MSITVNFYTFAKKTNSTKLVTGSSTTFNVALKEFTSIINPSLQINADNPTVFNYCYIPMFKRYYFIDNWVSEYNNIWSCDLTEDYLASWRSDILNSAQYVLRSASESDSDIIDTMYPVTSKMDFRQVDLNDRPIGKTLRYIFAVSNGQSNSVGGCTYYSLTYGEFTEVMKLLLGSSSYMGDFSVDGLSDSLVKAIVNPLQFVGECYILPYDIAGQSLSTLSCGWWVVDTSHGYHYLGNNEILAKHELWRKTITFPSHPQTATTGVFLNCSPYTEYILYAGVFGDIKLDATYIHNCTRVEAVVNGDFKGNIELEIHGHTMINGVLTDILIDKRNANCSIPISLTQLQNKPETILESGISAVSAIGSAVTANPSGLCSNLADGITSALDFIMPKAEGSASVGSFTEFLENWTLVAYYKNLTETQPNIYGEPLCKDKILSDLNGYCICSNSHIEISGTKTESETIEGILNGGFYIDT